MSLEQKYKDYFKLKTQEELYELIARLKMFIDLSLQESAAGNADDRLKSMHATILKLRDSLIYELSINNHSKNLLKMEIVKIGEEVEYMLSQTNKCPEPIYIENLLCKLLIDDII